MGMWNATQTEKKPIDKSGQPNKLEMKTVERRRRHQSRTLNLVMYK